jgi:hypothetical protein
MTKLYAEGKIRVKLIPRALQIEKNKGRLPGIDDKMMREFVQNLEAIWKEKHSELGDTITAYEMQTIIKRMRINHNDHLQDHHLDALSGILLDQNYEVIT